MSIYRLIAETPSFIGFSSNKSPIIHKNIFEPKLKSLQLIHQRIINDIYICIGLKGNGSYKNNQSNCKDVHLKCDHNVRLLVKELLESWLWTYGRNESSQVHNLG